MCRQARGRRLAATTLLALLTILGLPACTFEAPAGGAAPPAPDVAAAAPVPPSGSAPASTGPSAPTDPPAPSAGDWPLSVARAIDGDSFVASDGVEYRVGLVNTPELGTCGADLASQRTAALLADGFRAEAYAADGTGRTVARIHTPSGDLGVLLARAGLADDRYLARFRDEHPAYAAELDLAFAEARRAQAGLHATCPAALDRAAPPPTPASAVTHTGTTGRWPCHPAYVHCLPDGPDLDCADVGHQVELAGAHDPFRLDGNSTTATDGIGCDTYGPWDPTTTYPYHH